MAPEHESWMDMDTGPLPPVVQHSLNEAYAHLPPRPKRRKPAAGRALACMAACLAVLCLTNLADPVFAEKLPVVGGLFELLNDLGSESSAVNGILTEPQMANPKNPYHSTFPLEITLGEAYYDGRHLGVSMQMEVSDPLQGLPDVYLIENTEKDQPRVHFSALINGLDAVPETYSPFVRTGRTSYVCYLTFDISELYYSIRPSSLPTPPDTLNIRLELNGLLAATQDEEAMQTDSALTESEWSTVFTMERNDSLNRTYYPVQTANGITLETVQTTPTSTTFVLSFASEELHNLTAVDFPQDSSGRSYEWDGALRCGPYSMWTCGRVADDAETLSLCALDSSTGEVLAEFVVDLTQPE